MSFSRRRKSGAVLAEAVLACCIFVPVIVVIIWAVLEVSYAYVIGLYMSEAAHLAARALSDEFLRNPKVVSSPVIQQKVFSRIRIPMMVTSNEQFSLEEGAWVTKSLPRSVTVHCTYLPGVGDPPLPLFPNPDILNLRKKISIGASSTTPLF